MLGFVPQPNLLNFRRRNWLSTQISSNFFKNGVK